MDTNITFTELTTSSPGVVCFTTGQWISFANHAGPWIHSLSCCLFNGVPLLMMSARSAGFLTPGQCLQVMLYAWPISCITNTRFATHVFQWWGGRWSQCQTVVLSVHAWTSDTVMRNCWQTSCVHRLAKNAACISNLARLVVFNGATFPFENKVLLISITT